MIAKVFTSLEVNRRARLHAREQRGANSVTCVQALPGDCFFLKGLRDPSRRIFSSAPAQSINVSGYLLPFLALGFSLCFPVAANCALVTESPKDEPTVL